MGSFYRAKATALTAAFMLANMTLLGAAADCGKYNRSTTLDGSDTPTTISNSTSPSQGTPNTASSSPNTPPASNGSQGPNPATSATGTSDNSPTGGSTGSSTPVVTPSGSPASSGTSTPTSSSNPTEDALAATPTLTIANRTPQAFEEVFNAPPGQAIITELFITDASGNTVQVLFAVMNIGCFSIPLNTSPFSGPEIDVGPVDSVLECTLESVQRGSRLSANNGGTCFCGTDLDQGSLTASSSCGGGSRRRWAAVKRQASPVNIILAVPEAEVAIRDLDGNIEQPPGTTLSSISPSVSETISSSESTSGSRVTSSSTPSITSGTQMTSSTSSASGTSSDDDDDCEATDSSSSEGPSITEPASSTTEGPSGSITSTSESTGPSGPTVIPTSGPAGPIVLGIVGGPNANNTKRGLAARQASGSFIGGAGPINPDSCAEATKFELVDEELISGGQAVSVDPGLSFTEFEVSSTGSISTVLGVVAGTLVWANDAFSGGQAGFCQVPSGQVYITFAGPDFAPSSCEPVTIAVIPASECVDGQVPSGSVPSGGPAVPTWVPREDDIYPIGAGPSGEVCVTVARTWIWGEPTFLPMA
ncbi:hypothetical protein DL771_007515 [Monosporascus sp. 5C6A]|nr:hypothetical protein DL771_007515 [Monosporascus sp. 5C6A]